MIITARDHAVVLGAGMAGRLAARTVAGAYECVTIVDRDELPEQPIPRRVVCSFNPIYGQGITVAAIEALVLRDRAARRSRSR